MVEGWNEHRIRKWVNVRDIVPRCRRLWRSGWRGLRRSRRRRARWSRPWTRRGGWALPGRGERGPSHIGRWIERSRARGHAVGAWGHLRSWNDQSNHKFGGGWRWQQSHAQRSQAHWWRMGWSRQSRAFHEGRQEIENWRYYCGSTVTAQVVTY